MFPRFFALTNPNGVDELFRTFARDLGTEAQAQSAISTPLDIFEHADRFEVWLDLPGVAREDIKLSLENDTLRIQGERPAQAVTEETSKNFRRTERWTGSFARSLTLPSSVDGSRIEAKLTDGVLKLVLPKRDQAKPRNIPILG
jgi:HSP20 family protein